MAVAVTMPWLFKPGDGAEGAEQRRLLQKQIEKEDEIEKDGDPAIGYVGQSKEYQDVNDNNEEGDKNDAKAEREDDVRRG